eukprot:m.219965 g.219965  ORF g.219965 m.219965 type:complete len:607 (+) comp15918_c0_seq12:170-1990(+)
MGDPKLCSDHGTSVESYRDDEGNEGSLSASLPVLSTSDHPTSFEYSADKTLAFGKNHVFVLTAHQCLRGYLSIHTTPACGPTVSWIPYSLMRARDKESHPDRDKEILVLLHNVAKILVRSHLNSTSPGNGIANSSEHCEVILVGVDKVAFPGFHFYHGIEEFLAAISSEVVLEKLGHKEGTLGRRETMFQVIHTGLQLKPSQQKSNGKLVKSLYKLFDRVKFQASSKRKESLESWESRVKEFVKKRELRKKRNVFIALRLFAYRRGKIKQNVMELFVDDIEEPIALSTSRQAQAPKKVSLETWGLMVNEEGKLHDPNDLYLALYAGGCDDSIRCKIWKFLLGQYPLHSTEAERETRDIEVKHAYDALISELEHARAQAEESDDRSDGSFIDQCSTIDLDVERADFVKDSIEEYRDKLRNILRAVVYGHGENMYVQGMSDLLEPILAVLRDESSAHFCFTQLLVRAAPRFDNLSEYGIQKSLMTLRCLLAYFDPDLSEHLKSLDSDHMYFAYRWLLLDFKREFTAPSVLCVWETIWASRAVATKLFPVFIAIAIFKAYRSDMFGCSDFPSILKLLSDIQSNMNATEVLHSARCLVNQLRSNSLNVLN